jgi:predicted DNA-binding ribbon-helix-helix protein
MTRPVKRSLAIRGHRTSVSLEPEFWDALRSVASERRESIAALIGSIDEARDRSSRTPTNLDGLSSRIRVFLLKHFQRAGGR